MLKSGTRELWMSKAVKAVITGTVMLTATLGFAGDAPRVFSLDATTLQNAKQQIATQGEEGALKAKVVALAESAMRTPLHSVMEKDRVPPSGNKHDFFSLAPYWWPDPTKPGGMPFIRRDGERYPEAQKIPDRDYISDTNNSAYKLAAAYWLTGNEKYAERATLLLRTWFLDPATRMNPNLNYGQAVMGKNDGRGSGLIETRVFIRTVDAVGYLAGSKAWTAADQKGMEEWFGAYLKWLQDSPNGRAEADAKNNHGSWYESQLSAIALFVGKTDVAKQVAEKWAKRRIDNQFEKDGRQPLELVRTKSMQYTTFNLLALSNLARIAEASGVNLWSYESKDGRGIRKGLDFLYPFVAGEKTWEYKQIAPYETNEVIPVLLLASKKYNDPKYAQLAEKLGASEKDLDSVLLRATFNAGEKK